MNNDKLCSNGNNTGRGRMDSETFHGKRSTGREDFGGYATANAGSRKVRTNTQGGGQLHYAILQHKPLEQRIIISDDVDSTNLTNLFERYDTLQLKFLSHIQKNKNYVDCIEASFCFAQAIELYTTAEGHKNIPAKQLTLFTDLSYSKELNTSALAQVISTAIKLFAYTQNTFFQGFQEAETISLSILSSVFIEINSRDNLQNFETQVLANLFNDASQLLHYIQNKPFQGTEKLKSNILFFIFQEINSRDNLYNFNSHTLASLAKDLVQVGDWNNVTSELLSKIGINVSQSDFNTFTLQEICSLAASFSIGQQLPGIWNWLINGLSTLNAQEIDELTVENAKQLYRAFLRRALDINVWNKKNPDAFLMVYLKQSLVKKILQELNDEAKKYSIQTLEFQKYVENILKKILLKDCSLTIANYLNPYPINFTIVKNTKLIAIIDVHGPWKLMCNGHYHMTHTFQEKLLKDMGYSAVINIDFHALKNSKNREILLTLKLSRVFELNNKDAITLIDNSKLNNDLIQSNKTSRQNSDNIQPIRIETPVRKQNTTSPLSSHLKPPVVDNFINSQKMVIKHPSNLKWELKDKI